MGNPLMKHNLNVTSQTAQATPEQVKNNAGGYVFEVSDKSRLERFLIIGTSGGTYYVSEKKITDENIKFLTDLIAKDEAMVLKVLTDVNNDNRAYKMSPIIFTAAMLHHYGKNKAGLRSVLPSILRTSTHLFEYAQYVKNLGGWGRSKRGAVKDWYESKTDEELAYQLVKYRQREGWTHRDLLRLSHATPSQGLAEFALGKEITDTIPDVINGYTAITNAKNVKEVLLVLNEYPMLPWEAVPTEFHKNAEVWKTIFYNGSLKGSALLRNVKRLAKLEAFNDLDFAHDYAAQLSDKDAIKRARLHPINYLNASVVYSSGSMDRNSSFWNLVRNKDWETNSMIAKALDEGFYNAFASVTPANKKTLVAIDVSGSMASPAMGLELSCAQVSAAMAMTLVRTEPKVLIKGFSGDFVDLDITATDNLNAVMKKISSRNFGSTDCALPMVWANKKDVDIDTFAVFTDNETYSGSIHPNQALKEYRKKTGIDARLGVFGVAGTNFTIADPKDKGMMDFVGFDASAPKLFTEFSAGNL